MSEKVLDTCGIYAIVNTLNNKVYVGRAANLRKRWLQHKSNLNNSKHHSRHLQNAWEKHGKENFKFIPLVLNLTIESEIQNIENYYIVGYQSCKEEFGYNLAMASGTNKGVKYSEESRAKMRVAQKGRTFTQEAKERISKTLTGKVQSEQTIEKRRSKLIGMTRTEEQKERYKNSLRNINAGECYEAFGKTQHLRDWAKEYSINHATLSNRIKRGGYSLEYALAMPIRKKA